MVQYELVRRYARRIPKFGIVGTEFHLRVFAFPEGLDYVALCDQLYDVLAAMLRELMYDASGVCRWSDHHRVRLSLQSASLDHEIWIPFLPPSQLTVERIMLSVERVLQSNQGWLLDGGMRVLFVHAPLPEGGRGMSVGYLSSKVGEFIRQKRSLLQIAVDRHGMCFARAVIVSVSHVDGHRLNRAIRRPRSRVQLHLARVLMHRIGLSERDTCGCEEWERVQRVLGSLYSLVVLSRDLYDAVVYYGNPGAPRVVSVYHVDSHYHSISSLCGFLGVGYVCPYCHAQSRSKLVHRCAKTCVYCHSPAGDCVVSERVYCDACNILLPSRKCYDAHLSGSCAHRCRCATCGRVYVRVRGHTCNVRLCPRCKKTVPIEHQCYMSPLAVDAEESRPRPYIFYDFESMLSSGGVHVPNLCVAHRVCTLCMAEPMDSVGGCVCGRERVVFEGVTALEQFGEYVLNGRRKGAICIAHNSSGYDAQFILGYVHRRRVKPKMVMQGRKIMCLEVRGVRFVDSLNFFPMALSQLPKAFDVSELKKGYFPHLFNVPTSWNYRGPLPAPRYYGVDGMTPSRREDFMEWYERQGDRLFCFRDELVAYCRSDVDILQRCCGIFRKLFVEYTGLEPYTRSITIASACNRVYRTHYLKPDVVALIPPEGHFKGRQSAIALCWLTGLCRSPDVDIRHYGNGGEQRVCDRFVDGVGSDGRLYFFHGCFWHSCERCYRDRSGIHPVKRMSHRENYDQTLVFMLRLRESGYIVVEMWECTFRASMTADDHVLLAACRVYEPLRPRDGFYGGRCNAMTLHASASASTKIKYVDFTSLYPYVNRYCHYPIHHPEQYHGAAIPERVEGLIRCRVMPPTSLYHPVLPYRSRGKLLFPLCRTCAESGIAGTGEGCTHTSPSDRALVGTWVSFELEKACSVGYRVLERYEAWHFPHTSVYDPETRSGGIWSDFISRWVGLKAEASGYPSGVESREEQAAYLADYEKHEGITLDPSRVRKNEGLRSLAKLMANSHWGKSAQQSNKVQLQYISDPVEYVSLMSDSSKTVHDVFYVSDEYVAVQWSHQLEYDEGLAHTNVVLACYTTAHARLLLYELLESLQERALYCDTDSVIYVHASDGSYNPPLSNYLGGLKDELPDVDIVAYCGLGPKNYALKLSDGSSICKVRGFSLSYRTNLLLNFDVMSEMILSGDRDREVKTCDPDALVRSQTEPGVIRTTSHPKVYRMVYEKRVVSADGIHTVPFGWMTSSPSTDK